MLTQQSGLKFGGHITFKFYVWGNGLGLYIAKQIIDAHHSTIHASSEGEGKGSAFVIELPTISGPPSSS